MTAADRRLAAILAAFVPERAVALAALLGAGSPGDEVRSAVAALARAPRPARLAELRRALAPPEEPVAGCAEHRVPAAPPLGPGRLVRRHLLEVRAAG